MAAQTAKLLERPPLPHDKPPALKIRGYAIEGPAELVTAPAACRSAADPTLTPPQTLSAVEDGTRVSLKLLPWNGASADEERIRQLLRSVVHANLEPVLDAFIDTGQWGTVLVVVHRWNPPLVESTAPRLTMDTAAKATAALLSASRQVQRDLGTVPCNIKPSNILCDDKGRVVLFDWYVPFIQQNPLKFSAEKDRRGLAAWLREVVEGRVEAWDPMSKIDLDVASEADEEEEEDEALTPDTSDDAQPPARQKVETYQNFLRALETTTDDVSQHKWLETWKPVMLSESSHRTRVNALELCGTSQETEDFVMHSMLSAATKGFLTDKYVSPHALRRIRSLASSTLAAMRQAGTPLTMEAIEGKVQSLASVLCAAPKSDKPLPLTSLAPSAAGVLHTEGVWFSEGSSLGNQDRVSVVPDLTLFAGVADGGGGTAGASSPDFGCVVLDGHSGAEAAEFAMHQLLLATRRHPSYADDVPAALRAAFADVNLRFCQRAASHGVTAGTTATAAIIRDGRLHVAAAGDTGAVLCRGGAAVALTVDHRPTNASEKKAVTDRGGCVLDVMGILRVEGRLAVTRSLGDYALQHVISAEPDVRSETLTAEDSFLVVASDGLWDVMQPDEVVLFVQQCKQEIDTQSGAETPSLSYRTPSARHFSTATPPLPIVSALAVSPLRGVDPKDSTLLARAPSSFVANAAGERLERSDKDMRDGVRSEGGERRVMVQSKRTSGGTCLRDWADSKCCTPLRGSRGSVDADLQSFSSTGSFRLRTLRARSGSQMAESIATTTTTDTEYYDDYQIVAEALVAEAQERLSSDDITVCIVFFKK